MLSSLFSKIFLKFSAILAFVSIPLFPLLAFPVFAGQATLSWFPNSEPDVAGYVVYYKDDSNSQPLTKTQFTQKAILPVDQTTFTKLGLGTGTHSFALAAFDTSSNESQLSVAVQKTFSASGASTTSSDTTPPGDILFFSASSGDGEITLSWTNPDDVDFVGVSVRYRTDHFPESINDGVLLQEISGRPNQEMVLTHSDLENGLTYYYLAATFDASGNLQTTVFAKAKPSQNQNISDISSGGGGCGLIFPTDDTFPPGPGDAADMLALFGGVVLLLLKKKWKLRVTCPC